MKALTRSATAMAGGQCPPDKMAGLRGGRELATTQAASLVSGGRRWPGGRRRDVPAGANSYHGGCLYTGGRATRATASAWCWMKEAAAKSWRRDLQMTVSSLVFSTAQETIASLLLPLDSCRWRGKETDGAEHQNDYFYPRGILHREGVGRSWAIENTSNISGVE